MKYEWILTLIMGAFIGYCTNWLAIKMLFRPYNEKRIVGIKVPFTPGVIPKERGRMAVKIGEVVEEYLLTDDLIVQELNSESVQNTVVQYVEDHIFNGDGHISLERLGGILKTNDAFAGTVEDVVCGAVLNLVRDKETKVIVLKTINEAVINGLKTMPLEKVLGNPETLQNKLHEMVMSPKVKSQIVDYLNNFLDEDKSINQIIPEDIQKLLEQSVYFNTPSIIGEIKVTLQKSEIEARVTQMIDQVVSEKMGGLGAMFVNAPDIYKTILDKADEQLDDPEVQKQLMDFVVEKLGGVYKKQLFEVIPAQMKDGLVNQLADQIQGVVAKDIPLDQLLDLEDGNVFDRLDDLTSNQLETTILSYLDGIYDSLIYGDQAEVSLKSGVSNILNKIGDMTMPITDGAKAQLSQVIKTWYNRFITKSIRGFLNQISLGKIIEKEINGFDTKMIEEIIFDIAKHELNAITRLGALLGLVLAGIILLV